MQRLAKDLSAPLRELDVSTLHLLILEHILGMAPNEQVKGENIRYSQDEDLVLQSLEKEDYQAAFILNDEQVKGENIRYSQDEDLVLQSLEKEDYQAAFILNATKAEEIQTIVAGGEKMPQKSTYFYPKLLSGLVVNKIEPNEEIPISPSS